MKRFFIILIMLLSCMVLGTWGQHPPLDKLLYDSLYRIKPHSRPEQKVEIYLETARLICDTLPLEALGYIESAFQLSVRENDSFLKARSRMALGDYFAGKRDFMLAQEHYLAAMEIFKMNRDTSGELNTIRQIGALNSLLANYDIAMAYFEKGMKLAKATGIHALTGVFIENQAIVYQSKGDYERAISVYQVALQVFQLAGDKTKVLSILNSIGSVYLEQQKYNVALLYYNELLKKAGTSDRSLLGSIYTRIGHIYYQKKDYHASLAYNQKALTERQLLQSPIEINSSLINIAGDYYKLGMPDSGKVFFDKGLRLALKFDRKNLVENAYRHLHEYYLSQGDYEHALEYFRKYNAVNMAIEEERNKSNISILEANQQILRSSELGNILKKRHEVQTLNIENQKYQFTFVRIITSLAAGIMVVFIFQFLYARRVKGDMQKLHAMLSEEIRDREAVEQQTREREQQFRFLSENSVDYITHMDSQQKNTYSSPSALKIYGYEQDEMAHLPQSAIIHPDYIAYTDGKFKEMLETRTSRQYSYQALKKDGTGFWVESILNPLFDPATDVFKGIVGVTRDIQERKTKELEIMEGTKQKENLLKEIHHRVKNNFAILVSLINMQMAQTKNPELVQSLTNLQLRIRTMALVHEMLYRSKDFENISFADYLRSLASVIAGTYNRRDIQLTFEADESVMDIEASIPLGLIVNEILSNSYKHAFPDGRTGNIWITYKADPETGSFYLVLQDDGIGMPSHLPLDQYKSMGLQVVQILCQQIESELELTNDHGTTFTISYKRPGSV